MVYPLPLGRGKDRGAAPLCRGINILFGRRSTVRAKSFHSYHIGGQAPASYFLVPSLAVRYGLLLKETHHTHSGLARWAGAPCLFTGYSFEFPKKGTASPCPPDVRLHLLTHQLRYSWQLVKGLFLNQHKPYAKQLIYTCPHNLFPCKRIGMCRTLT